jgi:hypothetical protein
MFIWGKVCFYKQVPREKRHLDHNLSIAAFASDPNLWKKNLNRFFDQAFVDHIFEPAFCMQDIPGIF